MVRLYKLEEGSTQSFLLESTLCRGDHSKWWELKWNEEEGHTLEVVVVDEDFYSNQVG